MKYFKKIFTPLKLVAVIFICTACETLPKKANKPSRRSEKVNDGKHFNDNFYMHSKMRNDELKN